MFDIEIPTLFNMHFPFSEEYKTSFFLVLALIVVLLLLFFFFQDKLKNWISITKEQLRTTLRSYILKSHVSADGKTIRTTEPASFMTTIVNYIDHLFLAPEDTTEYTDKNPDILHDMEEYEYGGDTDEEESIEEGI